MYSPCRTWTLTSSFCIKCIFPQWFMKKKNPKIFERTKLINNRICFVFFYSTCCRTSYWGRVPIWQFVYTGCDVKCWWLLEQDWSDRARNCRLYNVLMIQKDRRLHGSVTIENSAKSGQKPARTRYTNNSHTPTRTYKMCFIDWTIGVLLPSEKIVQACFFFYLARTIYLLEWFLSSWGNQYERRAF